jgi:hypothetical protein
MNREPVKIIEESGDLAAASAVAQLLRLFTV